MCFITCNMSLVLEINYLILSYLITNNETIRIITKIKSKHSCGHDSILVYRPGYFTVHPSPAPSGPKFSNSENCCGSENAMPPKIFWDMEGHRGHFRSKNVFFFKKHILEKIHNKSNYFLNF